MPIHHSTPGDLGWFILETLHLKIDYSLDTKRYWYQRYWRIRKRLASGLLWTYLNKKAYVFIRHLQQLQCIHSSCMWTNIITYLTGWSISLVRADVWNIEVENGNLNTVSCTQFCSEIWMQYITHPFWTAWWIYLWGRGLGKGHTLNKVRIFKDWDGFKGTPGLCSETGSRCL